MGIDWAQQVRDVKQVILDSIRKATRAERPVISEKLEAVVYNEFNISPKRTRLIISSLVNQDLIFFSKDGGLWAV